MDQDMTRVASRVDFSPFSGVDAFLRWVATNYGSDVKRACQAQIISDAENGKSVRPLAIVDELTRNTRQIDRSRLGIRARFTY
jgi:hypothetical protein